MAEKITYSTSYTDGGSPWWASHRRYDSLGPNSAGLSAIVEDDGDDEWETPCAQITVTCFVRIDGDCDYYDVNITMDGGSRTKSMETGTNRTTGGLNWRFTDDKGNNLSRGQIRAANAPQAVARTRLGPQTYTMRIQNGVTTAVGFASVAGGIQISPTKNDYYINVQAGGWVSVVCQITARIKQAAVYWHSHGSEERVASLPADPVRVGGDFEDAAVKTELGQLMGRPDDRNYDEQLEAVVARHEQASEPLRRERKTQRSSWRAQR